MDVPPPGTRTLSEVNSQLSHLENPETSPAFPSCPELDLKAGQRAQPDLPVGHVRFPGGAPAGYDAADGSWRSPEAASPLQTLLRNAPDLPSRAGLPLAWHATRPLLAAADAGGGVQVFDFEGRVPYLGQPQQAGLPPPLAPSHVLKHELQAGVAALAWRPNAGATLAAGGASGACLWHLAKGAATPAASLVWLQSPGGAPAAALAWHPRGHLLAAASPRRPGFHVWDVATGAATSIRAGMEAVSLLRWSPCGSYLLAGSASGGFRLWETATWFSAGWTGGAPGGGALVDAAWAPDGRTLLLAHGAQLSALHLTGEPPSLAAQALPVALPELSAGGAGGGAAVVAAAAWDSRGQRLAVALGGAHPAKGCVALYDTRCDPILSVRFVGYMRVAPVKPAEPDWEIVEAEESEGEQGGADENGAGGSRAARRAARKSAETAPVLLAFQPAFAQGAVLSVREGDFVGTVPMYFSS